MTGGSKDSSNIESRSGRSSSIWGNSSWSQAAQAIIRCSPWPSTPVVRDNVHQEKSYGHHQCAPGEELPPPPMCTRRRATATTNVHQEKS